MRHTVDQSCLEIYIRKDVLLFFQSLDASDQMTSFRMVSRLSDVGFASCKGSVMFHHVNSDWKNDVFVCSRESEKKTNLGSSWDSNQDLLNTSQMHLPLSHLDPWQRSRKQAT